MKIEGLIVPIKNPAGFLFQKLEFDCKSMIMRGKRALARAILLQPRLLGNFHFFCTEIQKNKDRKKENKLYFSWQRVQAPSLSLWQHFNGEGYAGLCLLYLEGWQYWNSCIRLLMHTKYLQIMWRAQLRPIWVMICRHKPALQTCLRIVAYYRNSFLRCNSQGTRHFCYETLFPRLYIRDYNSHKNSNEI